MTIRRVKIKQRYSYSDKRGTIIPLVDERGFITPLIDEDKFKVKNVIYIFSKKGAIRGNHYHKKESYWEYCAKGKFRYYQKDLNDPNAKLESVIIKEGEMIYSPAGIAHAIKTLEDTIILCIASRSRKEKNYLRDLVRVKII